MRGRIIVIYSYYYFLMIIIFNIYIDFNLLFLISIF